MSKKQDISKQQKKAAQAAKREYAQCNSKSKMIEQQGTVIDNCGNTNFKIELDVNGMVVQGTISGKMRMHYIKVSTGDRVMVEISPYDLTKCRITKRL